ncbi:MAG: alpha/beta hydrolase [Sneathiella sp.]
MSFEEKFYQSNDGLNLYYREYGGDNQTTPVVCLSGLTRNSADFHDFALRYSGTRKVYCLDYRGRGKSDYDPECNNYNPQTYAMDALTFLSSKSIENAIFVGTSLGGIIAMGLSGLAPQYVSGAILNDIGPDIDTSGSERIADYVGKDIRFSSLKQAVSAQKKLYINAYPDLDDEGWLKTTEAAYVYDDEKSNYRQNYDLKLGQALGEQIKEDQQIDLWPFFESLKSVPTLAIRGALSDILSEETFDKMKAHHPQMQWLQLENRGHVPLLDEPLALNKMDKFFDQQ